MSSAELLARYGPLDRLLHRLAFRGGALQVALADMEDSLHKSTLEAISVDRPVLVTALPRAGTTLLLELLYATGEFASHSYRHMPFVLCPLFWQRLSGGFRSRDDARMQRAHDDGMEISLDSVESFEEMIWRRFWGSHYLPDRIRPWAHCSDAEFTGFLGSHLRKIIHLASLENPERSRYLSKNNGNIARLGCLDEAFHHPIVLVPFRHPLEHAGSLLRQHLQFLRLHDESRFALEYMRGIGHFDFGRNLLPVDFGGWLDRLPERDPSTLDFWLHYWITAYGAALEATPDNIHLVSYDGLRQSQRRVLGAIAGVTRIRNAEALVNMADRIRPARKNESEVPSGKVGDGLVDEALSLFDRLRERAIS